MTTFCIISACGHDSLRCFLQGTASAEVQAVSQAGPAARGSIAYLNLETGDSHGDMSSVIALVNGGVSRVVIGLLHPLPHLRGQAVRTLKAAGVSVDVLQPDLAAQGQAAQQCLQACLKVNEVSAASEHLALLSSKAPQIAQRSLTQMPVHLQAELDALSG